MSVLAITVVPFRLHRHRHAPWWLVVQPVPFHVPPVSFALNILMFVPFGVLLPLVWRRTGTAAWIGAASFITSLAIELTQLVEWIALGNYRTVDVNDLIANTAGGLLGFAVIRLSRGGRGPGVAARARREANRR